MEIQFTRLNFELNEALEKHLRAREIRSCEANLAILYLWDQKYETMVHIAENYALIMETYNGEEYALMPMCKEEYFKEAFEALCLYVEKNNKVLRIYCADEVFAEFVVQQYGEKYKVYEERHAFDYLYLGEDLRSLVGKKFSKKRNHINSFLEVYGERYTYRPFTSEDEKMVESYIRQWNENRGEAAYDIEHEIEGICLVMRDLELFKSKAAGIFIDGNLEAISLGSLINGGKEVIVHTEKANPEIRGLYPFINQQFLVREFPEVELVNREDDVGEEGLRKAKLSYNPIELVKKFTIIESID